jgi:hypothetical protein
MTESLLHGSIRTARAVLERRLALPKHRPLVLCDPGQEGPARSAGFTAVAWTEFLFDRW